MSYTPDTGSAVVLNFNGSYTPDSGSAVVLEPATGLVFAGLELDQSWASAAPTFTDGLLDAQWSLVAPEFAAAPLDQFWVLKSPEYQSAPLDQSWNLVAAWFDSALMDQGWAAIAPAFADAPLDIRWALMARTITDLALDQAWSLEATAAWSRVVSATAYIFALEQGADRVEIPIANFSGQLRSGEPSYLQVSIPNAWSWAATIQAYAAHADTEMVIDAGSKWSDGTYTTQEIARTTLRNVQQYFGATSASVNLDGTDTRTNPAPTSHVLTGASYLNMDAGGKLRYRVTPNFAVRPGDTVSVGNDTFVVGELSYQVSPTSASMEVAEAQ